MLFASAECRECLQSLPPLTDAPLYIDPAHLRSILAKPRGFHQSSLLQVHPLITSAAATASAPNGSSPAIDRKPGSYGRGQGGGPASQGLDGGWGQRQEAALPICSSGPGGAPVLLHCSVRQEVTSRAGAVTPPRNRIFPVGSTGYLESQLHRQLPLGQVELSLYSKLWVYNCTGLPLAIRAVPLPAGVAVAAAPALPCPPPPVWVQPCLNMEGAATSARMLFPMASRAAAVAAAASASAESMLAALPAAATPLPLNGRRARHPTEITPLRPQQLQPPQRLDPAGDPSNALLVSPLGAHSAALGLVAGSGLGLGVLASPLTSPVGTPAGGASVLRDQAVADLRSQGRRVAAPKTPVSALLQKGGKATPNSVRSMATTFLAPQDGFVPPCMCGDLTTAAASSPTSLDLQLCVSPHTALPSGSLLPWASSLLPAPWSCLLSLEEGAAPMVAALPHPMPAGDAWHASLSGGASPPADSSAAPSFLAAVRLVRVLGAPPGCFALHVLPRFILHNTLQVSYLCQQLCDTVCLMT